MSKDFDIIESIVNLYDTLDNIQQLSVSFNSLCTNKKLVTLSSYLIHNMQGFERKTKK